MAHRIALKFITRALILVLAIGVASSSYLSVQPKPAFALEPIMLYAKSGPLPNATSVVVDASLSPTDAQSASVNYILLRAEVPGLRCWANVGAEARIYSQGQIVILHDFVCTK